MRIPKLILEDIKTTKKEENPEKMDFLMRTIKAVHSAGSSTTADNSDELEKQRSNVDSFSRLITPILTVSESPFTVGSVNCEWVSPSFAHRVDKLILYCHGGGYISGGLGYARILAAKMASHTGIECVSFEYRLSPENKYPAAIEDATAVWDYLMQKGYGASDIILAGDSAGGNLALELCLKLKQEERKMPKALVLFSPWTDMTCSGNSYNTYKDKDLLLTKEYIMSARRAYAGEEADFSSPEYSPLFAELSSMPPALVQVGSNEILRDDSEMLVKRLRKSGSHARLEMYTGGWHVFQQMPIPRASQAIDNVKLYLDEVLR